MENAIPTSIKHELSMPFEFGREGEIVKELVLMCPRGRDLKGLSIPINIDVDSKTYNADYDIMRDAISRCLAEPALADLMFMPDIVGAYQKIYENFTLPS